MKLMRFIGKTFRYTKSFLDFSKKVCFYGPLGHGNAGDEATFTAAQGLFDSKLRPLSKKLGAFTPWNIKALLIGGGGIFHWKSPYFPRRLLELTKWQFPIIIFSAGINCDYYAQFSSFSLDKIKKLCDMSDLITVRDESSRLFLQKLGVKKNIETLPDLALVLKETPIELDFKKDSLCVGISLATHTEFASNSTKEYKPVILKFVKYLINKGYTVIFIPFQISGNENIDERLISSQLASEIKDKEKVKLIDNHEPSEILYIIKNCCDFMLGMRLHANVLAANAGIPFLSLSYNVKHNAFLKMLKQPQLNVPLIRDFSFDLLKEKFEEVIRDYEPVKASVIRNRNMLVEEIHNEINIIKDRYLKDRF